MLTIEVENMGRVVALLETLGALGKSPKGAELIWEDRELDEEEDEPRNNWEVASGLVRGGRDFFGIERPVDSTRLAAKMIGAIMAEVKSLLGGLLRLKRPPSRVAMARNATRNGLLSAMEEYKLIVRERILGAKLANGEEPRDLSPAYKEVKMAKVGFLYPIGIATRQLFDNMKPGSENVKINN